MFTKIEKHLYLGDENDYNTLKRTSMYNQKPYLFVDARPFFNMLCSDPIPAELMIEPLRALSASIAMLVSNDVTVYIYCQAGIERSPFLTALVLLQLGEGTLEECYQKVAKKRTETLVYSQWTTAYESSKNCSVEEK